VAGLQIFKQFLMIGFRNGEYICVMEMFFHYAYFFEK